MVLKKIRGKFKNPKVIHFLLGGPLPMRCLDYNRHHLAVHNFTQLELKHVLALVEWTVLEGYPRREANLHKTVVMLNFLTLHSYIKFTTVLIGQRLRFDR